jgi:hypothetical protein
MTPLSGSVTSALAVLRESRAIAAVDPGTVTGCASIVADLARVLGSRAPSLAHQQEHEAWSRTLARWMAEGLPPTISGGRPGAPVTPAELQAVVRHAADVDAGRVEVSTVAGWIREARGAGSAARLRAEAEDVPRRIQDAQERARGGSGGVQARDAAWASLWAIGEGLVPARVTPDAAPMTGAETVEILSIEDPAARERALRVSYTPEVGRALARLLRLASRVREERAPEAERVRSARDSLRAIARCHDPLASAEARAEVHAAERAQTEAERKRAGRIRAAVQTIARGG